MITPEKDARDLEKKVAEHFRSLPPAEQAKLWLLAEEEAVRKGNPDDKEAIARELAFAAFASLVAQGVLAEGLADGTQGVRYEPCADGGLEHVFYPTEPKKPK